MSCNKRLYFTILRRRTFNLFGINLYLTKCDISFDISCGHSTATIMYLRA